MSTGGGSFGGSEATAYPLLPTKQSEPKAEEGEERSKRAYIGRIVEYDGVRHIFGNATVFRCRPLKEAEIQDESRRMFAYGGLFAVEAGTYRRCVENSLKVERAAQVRSTLENELRKSDLPQTQAEMREWIERQFPAADRTVDPQMTLF